MRHFFFLLLLACSTVTLHSQATATFNGSITNSVTGNPVTAVRAYAKITGGSIPFTYFDSTMVGNGTFTITATNLPSNEWFTFSIYVIDSCSYRSEQTVSMGTNADSIYYLNFSGCQCNSNFQVTQTVNPQNPLEYQFTTNQDNPYGGADFSWAFNDGTTSILPNPSKTFPTYGVHEGCVTATVQRAFPAPPCNLSDCSVQYTSCSDSLLIQAIQVNTHSYKFYVDSTVFLNPVWDFGDGNQSTATDTASHTYIAGGQYYVTVSGYTSDSCYVFAYTMANVYSGDICGSILAANIYVDSAMVYLIGYDPVSQVLYAVDSVVTSSIYCFNGVSNGTYRTKAAAIPSSFYYNTYMPTYHDTTLYWNNAVPLAFNGTPIIADINLVPGNNPGGPGFIGGSVLQGANMIDYNPEIPVIGPVAPGEKAPGDPVPGVVVLLLDANNNPVAYNVTNSNGEYSFSNIALGTYHVYPEVLNLVTVSSEVTIDNGNPTVDDVNFGINTTGVTSVSSVSIKGLQIYPNPANEQFILSLPSAEYTGGTLQITDMNGKTVFSSTPAELQNTVFTSGFRAGNYIVKYTAASGAMHIEKVIITH